MIIKTILDNYKNNCLDTGPYKSKNKSDNFSGIFSDKDMPLPAV
jgi:hypothetical protein